MTKDGKFPSQRGANAREARRIRQQLPALGNGCRGGRGFFSVLPYLLNRNERAQRRTLSPSDFLFISSPLAVSIPTVGRSLIAFLPSALCGWRRVCLWNRAIHLRVAMRATPPRAPARPCMAATADWMLTMDPPFPCPIGRGVQVSVQASVWVERPWNGVSFILDVFSLIPSLSFFFFALPPPPPNCPAGHPCTISVCSTPDSFTCCVPDTCWVMRETLRHHRLLPGTN